MSDDRRFGVTVIAFVGSVFSPYYAWSGRRDPLDHCAVNVALYRPEGNLWAMTERGRRSVQRAADVLTIGPSRLAWRDGVLTIDIDEVTAPLPSRVRGRITLRPEFLLTDVYALTADAGHVWRPIAPRARVTVELAQPAGRWSGDGYLDSNWGDAPIEDAFEDWDWSRAHLAGRTQISYDVRRRGGDCAHLALDIDAAGRVTPGAALPANRLPAGLWRTPRWVRPLPGCDLQVRANLEDTPFYTRTWLGGVTDEGPVEVMHESLAAARLRSPVVKAMLPFRMPRSPF